ncbi:MAG: cyclic nucleotide-binding domain-containing protein [Rhizobiaceae bacterium]|nr:cyclic nucleotide-binding domain-containing protein [Rhizobiaceae bacterium]
MDAFLTEFWSDFSRPENFVGHFAYVLLIISMMMRNMNWLRFFAIMAGSISAVFYYTIGDFVSMFWESMFTLVNLGQFVALQVENRRGKFSEEEAMFIETCLSGVERAYARRLMKLGAWTEVQDGVLLFEQNTCPSHLMFIVSGNASVRRDGKIIGNVKRGDFLGEMSYLTGKMATATVVTTEQTRYLAFERKALQEHLEKNTEVRHALEASFNRNLVSKLVSTNEQSVGGVEA